MEGGPGRRGGRVRIGAGGGLGAGLAGGGEGRGREMMGWTYGPVGEDPGFFCVVRRHWEGCGGQERGRDNCAAADAQRK